MEEVKTNSKAVFPYTNKYLERDINHWANWAVQNNHNIALYRKPEEDPMMLMDEKPLTKVSLPIEELNKGFVLANYRGDLWHMEASRVVKFDNLEEINLPIEENNHDWAYYTNSNQQPTTSKEDYMLSVQQGIDSILTSNLVKIVPTKIKLHKLTTGFSLANAFVKLCEK